MDDELDLLRPAPCCVKDQSPEDYAVALQNGERVVVCSYCLDRSAAADRFPASVLAKMENLI